MIHEGALHQNVRTFTFNFRNVQTYDVVYVLFVSVQLSAVVKLAN